MALANFFDKIALGAAQLLKGMNRQELQGRLSSQRVTLFFDLESAQLTEGRAMLDLSVRLLARLYPYLRIQCSSPNLLETSLFAIAQSINPDIDSFDIQETTIALIIGGTPCPVSAPAYYIGSEDWTAKYSTESPRGCGSSTNPFGAGGAACIGTANVFRHVFRDLLPGGGPDDDTAFSLLTDSVNTAPESIPIDAIDLGEVFVVGLGAIGSGFSWVIQHLPKVCGHVNLIDAEAIALSNLQRYVLTAQDDIGKLKTEHLAQMLNSPTLRCTEISYTWQEYLHKRADWRIETVVTALDNAADRIAVQAALPKVILNAWTQPENIGVSRHFRFSEDPGLCCVYHPTGEAKSRSHEIADNLRLPHFEMQIRRYLVNHIPVDAALIQLVHQSTGIPIEILNQFVGKPLEIFYSEVVCGGVVVRYSGESDQMNEAIQVPCAFQSAMAGILLAAELIKYKSGYPVAQTQSVRLNLLRPLSEYFQCPEIKRTHCICTDPVFKSVYSEKWGVIGMINKELPSAAT